MWSGDVPYWKVSLFAVSRKNPAKLRASSIHEAVYQGESICLRESPERNKTAACSLKHSEPSFALLGLRSVVTGLASQGDLAASSACNKGPVNGGAPTTRGPTTLNVAVRRIGWQRPRKYLTLLCDPRRPLTTARRVLDTNIQCKMV